MEKYDNYGPPPSTETWPVQTADTPKIQSLDVKCERNLMKVFIGMYVPYFVSFFLLVENYN